MLLWHVRQTHSGFHRYYTQTYANSWFYYKGSNIMNVLHNLIDLYMAHRNSLGICSQLKIRHLYGTFNFSTQCICLGTGSLFVYRFSPFSWKGAPSTKKNRISGSVNKRVRNLAVSKEPWDISEVIRDKHGINKNILGLGPQKKYSSRATSAAEKVCLSRMTPNWRMRKWNTELAYWF